MPNLYIIAGCNGAGKTTASLNVLLGRLDCSEFINADEIAKGLSPLRPEKFAIRAGRIMLELIDQYIEERLDFAIETTLTTSTYRQTIQRAREAGYEVTLLFFWLSSPDQAVNRVKQRVSEGGHNIPEETIRRRYHRGIDNLFRIFLDICDNYMIIDNSTLTLRFIDEKMGGVRVVHDSDLLEQLKRSVK